jgi:hypothetical protein
MKAKEEWVEYINTMHLQNNTEKEDFDKAFRFGIESAVEEMLEYTNQRVIEELYEIEPCLALADRVHELTGKSKLSK